MKSVIYCFSGTGNTKIMCDMLKMELVDFGCDTDIFMIDYQNYKQNNIPNPNDYDIIGIAYPIYGFNAPFLVNRFVKKLPKATNSQRVFVIKTSGEPFSPNNYSSAVIKKTMTKKGYTVSYEQHYLMPYNIMFRYPDALAKQMYIYVKSHTKVLAHRIVLKKNRILHGNPLGFVLYVLGKLVWVGGPIIGKTYSINKKKCSKCKVCAKGCPMENIVISMNEYPKFKGHCMICMHCVMYCPHNAIRAGILNKWKVNGPYNYGLYLNNDGIGVNYVNKDTKGYFRSFNKYFDSLDKDLLDEGIKPPRELLS